MTTLAELKQILKEDHNGHNLYEHLTQTLMQLLIERPSNAFESFELISAQVKASPLQSDPQIGKPLPLPPEQLEMQLGWMRNSAASLKIPEEPPEEPAVKLPNLFDDAKLYAWASVHFSPSEYYAIFLSMKKLAESLPADCDRLRFFGRFSTRSRPYYVLETVSAEEEDGRDEMKMEGKQGANKFVYYVTQQLDGGQHWIKLPSVTCEQVVRVREIRRLLTGQLDAEVASYPPFPGRERELLRALLACIGGETSVSPDGFFDVDEESEGGNGVKPAEPESFHERFPKSALEVKDVESWRHHEVELNALGRATALPEQLDDQGEPIVPDTVVDVIPPLETVKVEQWTARLVPGGAGATSQSAVVLRSLKWPGAVAIFAKDRFVNVYVGNGLMEGKGVAYSPPFPKSIEGEYPLALPEGDESGALKLVEQVDVKVDPTPPVPAGEEAEE